MSLFIVLTSSVFAQNFEFDGTLISNYKFLSNNEDSVVGGIGGFDLNFSGGTASYVSFINGGGIDLESSTSDHLFAIVNYSSTVRSFCYWGESETLADSFAFGLGIDGDNNNRWIQFGQFRAFRKIATVTTSDIDVSSGMVVGLQYFTCIANDGTNSRQWLNGTQIGANTSDSTSTPSSFVNFFIGRNVGSAANKFDGIVGEFMVFNIGLTDDNVSALYNNGTGLFFDPIIPFVLNQSLEQTVQFLQIGTATIGGGGFTNVLSGSFNISVNDSQTYFAGVIPITSITSGNVGSCRLLIDGASFNSTFSRTNVAGESGNMYITTSNASLDIGSHTTQLQCERTSPIN